MNNDMKIVNSGIIEFLRKESKKSVSHGADTDLLVKMLISSDNINKELEKALKTIQDYEAIEKDENYVNSGMIELSRKLPAYEMEQLEKKSSKELIELVRAYNSISYIAMNWGNYMKQDKLDALEKNIKKLK